MISHRAYSNVSCEFLCLLDSSSQALITTLHDVTDAAADVAAALSVVIVSWHRHRSVSQYSRETSDISYSSLVN